MVSRKYTTDYRIDDFVDPKTGKVATRTEYIGTYYRFRAPEGHVAKARRYYGLLCAVTAVLFAVPMFLDASVLRAFYAALPFAALTIPMAYLVAGLQRLYAAKDQKVTREHRDKTAPRLRGCGISICALAGASLIGMIVSACLHGAGGADWVSMACAAAMIALHALALIKVQPVTEMAACEQDS